MKLNSQIVLYVSYKYIKHKSNNMNVEVIDVNIVNNKYKEKIMIISAVNKLINVSAAKKLFDFQWKKTMSFFVPLL